MANTPRQCLDKRIPSEQSASSSAIRTWEVDGQSCLDRCALMSDTQSQGKTINRRPFPDCWVNHHSSELIISQWRDSRTSFFRYSSSKTCARARKCRLPYRPSNWKLPLTEDNELIIGGKEPDYFFRSSALDFTPISDEIGHLIHYLNRIDSIVAHREWFANWKERRWQNFLCFVDVLTRTRGVLSNLWKSCSSSARLLRAIRRNKQSHSALTVDRQRITIQQSMSSMHVIRDGLELDTAWLAITAASDGNRHHCSRREWLPFFSLAPYSNSQPSSENWCSARLFPCQRQPSLGGRRGLQSLASPPHTHLQNAFRSWLRRAMRGICLSLKHTSILFRSYLYDSTPVDVRLRSTTIKLRH